MPQTSVKKQTTIIAELEEKALSLGPIVLKIRRWAEKQGLTKDEAYDVADEVGVFLFNLNNQETE